MPQLFINIIGHNASGKTTLAKKLEEDFTLNRINGDDFRNFVYSHIPYFNNVSLSFPSKRSKEARPLITNYRIQLTDILLSAKQNVIIDGSGAQKNFRDDYLRPIVSNHPGVVTVLIWADLSEAELLKRLTERDADSDAEWVRMYTELRKDAFEPPTEDEADLVLRYDQTNYDEIKQTIKEAAK